MSNLRDVAAQAGVSILTAYQILSNSASADSVTQEAVLKAARDLRYRLNVTLHDVADLAGVSIATVSYVLNDTVPVSEKTRERVLQATAQLNYRPNITARNLKASETRMIGYAWHDVPPGQINPVMDRFIYCLAQAAESYGYHVLTFSQPRKGEIKTYEELFRSNRVDGFILSNTRPNDKRIRHLMDMGVPFAAFGRANEAWDFPYVDVDGRIGIRTCVEHLFERGHERIAFLDTPQSGERLGGYLDAMENAGIKPNLDWILHTENVVLEAGNAIQRLIELSANKRPTAIVCATDMMAIGVMRYLGSVGLQVGKDIAVTGFDDQPMSEFLYPALTSLRQPIDWLAQKVIDLMMAEFDHERLPERQIIVQPELIIRGSSDQRFSP